MRNLKTLLVEITLMQNASRCSMFGEDETAFSALGMWPTKLRAQSFLRLAGRTVELFPPPNVLQVSVWNNRVKDDVPNGFMISHSA